jgi:hypothetical protein
MGSTRWVSLPNPPPSPATTSARCAAVPPRHSVHAAMKKWRIVYIRVWHGANDRRIPNFRGVRVHVITGYNSGEGHRLPSRNGFVRFSLTEIEKRCDGGSAV